MSIPQIVAKIWRFRTAQSFESAKLLHLSCIGPNHFLERFGIPVLRELPLGQGILAEEGCMLGSVCDAPLTRTNNSTKVLFASVLATITMGKGGPLSLP